MNVPPPFSPPEAPVRKNRTGLIVAIVLACILIPCVGLIALGYAGFSFITKEVFPIASCGIGFKHVRDALEAYADEHDGKLPSAKTWQDDVRPYYKKIIDKNQEEFGPIEPMAPDGDWGCRIDEKRRTGMAFNLELSGKKIDDVKDPESTIVLFEIDSPKLNAAEVYKFRGKEDAPKMMGERRSWLKVPLKGGKFDGDFTFE